MALGHVDARDEASAKQPQTLAEACDLTRIGAIRRDAKRHFYGGADVRYSFVVRDSLTFFRPAVGAEDVSHTISGDRTQLVCAPPWSGRATPEITYGQKTKKR